MKANEVAFLFVFLLLVCVVIKLSDKLQKMDQTVKLLSAQMDAAAAQINSTMQQAVQHKVPPTVGGFGAAV